MAVTDWIIAHFHLFVFRIQCPVKDALIIYSAIPTLCSRGILIAMGERLAILVFPAGSVLICIVGLPFWMELVCSIEHLRNLKKKEISQENEKSSFSDLKRSTAGQYYDKLLQPHWGFYQCNLTNRRCGGATTKLATVVIGRIDNGDHINIWFGAIYSFYSHFSSGKKLKKIKWRKHLIITSRILIWPFLPAMVSIAHLCLATRKANAGEQQSTQSAAYTVDERKAAGNTPYRFENRNFN